MDETIGVKGGHQDHIRTIRIEKEQIKKLEEVAEQKEIEQLEKEVKKKQRQVLIRVLPIAIFGEIVKTLYDTATGKEYVDKEDEYSKWKLKEYDADFTTKDRREKKPTKKVTIVLTDGRKVTITVPVEEKKKVEEKDSTLEPVKEEKKKDQITILPIPSKKQKKEEQAKDISLILPPIVEEKTEEELEVIEKQDGELTSSQKETLGKLKNRKIIDEYEKQLKDIRYTLRGLISDYNVLVDEGEEILFSDKAEELLERLSEVIRKIETLKDKIQIDHLEEYDDNYLYVLIEEYLSEFHDKKIVKDMKDSPLYILISEKIDEIENKKESFQKDVEDRKKELEAREVRFDQLKDKYYQLDKIDKALMDFQDEQEALLRQVEEKVRNSMDITEKVEVQMEAMDRQSRRLLNLMTLSLFFPGRRSARTMAATTAAYLYFARRILNPPTTTKKYQVITVADYHRDIENSILAIEDANELLKKTDKQVDQIIKEIRRDFSEYIGVLPECDQLLSNLEKIKSNLREKEYEMEKLKKQQEKQLEINNAKVLKKGTYPM